jgi:hypothetical protein
MPLSESNDVLPAVPTPVMSATSHPFHLLLFRNQLAYRRHLLISTSKSLGLWSSRNKQEIILMGWATDFEDEAARLGYGHQA